MFRKTKRKSNVLNCRFPSKDNYECCIGCESKHFVFEGCYFLVLDPCKRWQNNWRFRWPRGNVCACLERWVYGRYTGTLEFWSQCRIWNFGTIYVVCPIVNGRPREATGCLVTKSNPLTTPPAALKLRLLRERYRKWKYVKSTKIDVTITVDIDHQRKACDWPQI